MTRSGRGAGEHGGTQQPSEDGLQVVASIESVLHFSEIAMDVLVELERVNLDGGLQVADHGVDASELRAFNALTPRAHHDGRMAGGLAEWSPQSTAARRRSRTTKSTTP